MSNTVNSAFELSDVFTKLHGLQSNGNDFSVKEDDMKIILPFLFFNPKCFSLLKIQAMYKTPHVSYRLSYMRELFETPSIENAHLLELPLLFEECEGPEQKMAFLQRDLYIVENPDKIPQPLFLNLLQYSQYISDCLPILYAKFSRTIKLTTFLSVAFYIGDIAVKSFCFCFPNVIFPIFKTALERNSSSSLLAHIATMSPQHRPLLHPKLVRFPVLFSILAIKFFPDDSPTLILSAVHGCYPEIKNELATIYKPSGVSPMFFKLYARCCSANSTIDENDYDILKQCKDDKLIVATLFNIENIHTKYFTDWIRSFSQNSNTMSFLIDLLCDTKDHHDSAILQKIKKILGEDYEWPIKQTFSNHYFKNFASGEFKSSWFGSDAQGINTMSSLIEDVGFNNAINWLPNTISTLTKVDSHVINSLLIIVTTLAKNYPIDKTPDFRVNIDKFFRNVNFIFQSLERIAQNPAPAVACTIILLYAEEICAKRNWFKQIITLPLRFVVCCAAQFEGCSSIFQYLCTQCNKFAGHVFCQAPLMTHTPNYLLSKGNPNGFLQFLSQNISNCDEEMFKKWMIFRFISPFQYVVDTIDAIGGPSDFTQLHQVFDFPKDSIHNIYILQIISICLFDIVALYEKKYIPSGKDVNSSVVLILYSAFDLMKDPLVDRKTVCNFINDLFYLSPWVLDSFLSQGCDSDLIYTITHGVHVLETSWKALHKMIKSPSIKPAIRLFILEFASHLADANNNVDANKGCQGILAVLLSTLKVTDESLGMILDSVVRIYKVFPDLYPYIDKMLQNIKEQVTTRSSKLQLMSMVDLAVDSVTSYVFDTKEEEA